MQPKCHNQWAEVILCCRLVVISAEVYDPIQHHGTALILQLGSAPSLLPFLQLGSAPSLPPFLQLGIAQNDKGGC